MENLFGFYVYDKNQARIDGKWRNPYFKIIEHRHNTWTRWTAYVLPHFVPGTNNNSMVNVQYTNGQDWIWPSNAEYATLRFQSFHDSDDDIGCITFSGSADGDGHDPEGSADNVLDYHVDGDHSRTWYAFPSVREIDYVQRALPGRDGKVRTFDIADEQDWASVPNYIGKASVSGEVPDLMLLYLYLK